MKSDKMREYILNDSIDVKKRSFVLNFITIMIVLGITTLEIFFVPSMRTIAISTFIYILFICGIGLIAIRKDKIQVGAILISACMCYIYFPITFVNSGGIRGAGPMWFVFNMFLISVFLEGKIKNIFYALEGLVGLGCFIVAATHPDIFPIYDSMAARIYLFTAMVLISIGIILMIRFENIIYEMENKKAQEQREEIESLNAAQNRFFSSMSHEIRTPINTIIGLNEMILREDISDEVADDAVNIRVAGKLLLNLINDILDMSKFQAGDMNLLIEPYSPGNMLSDLVGMLWIRAREKNLEFNVNVEPDIPAELMGDEVRIKQVLMNILNNAIKYTKEGSITLSVECEKLEGENEYNIIYSVADTGMGIKKEDIPYLFDAFKRVDETSNKHIEGTGLGLSIVKQFLDLMGGKVTVNSVYTKGTTFIVEIPQKAASTKQIGEYDYKKRHGIGKRMNYKQKFEAPEGHILVVDDNEANLLVVTKLLRDTKLQIDTAKSGAEALKFTLNNRYHMIFMDHLMPEMDGIECYHAIRAQAGGQNRETPIVILTANAGEENRSLYAVTGFDGYLVKPVTGENLESEVYRFLPREIVKVTSEDGDVTVDSVMWMQAGQKKRPVVITTESVADLPPALLKKYKITTIPHLVRTEDGIFKDGVEIDTNGVLAYMEDTNHSVNPGPPDTSAYEAFFADQLTKANNVIHISISSKIQNTGYPIALEAANSFENVTVFDSSHLSSGQGLMAIVAARLADAGMNKNEILFSLENYKNRINTSFIVDSLEYLARSKQVTKNMANITKAFMARPLLVMKDGEMKAKKMYFGSREKTWKKYIDSSLSGLVPAKTIVFVTYVGLSKKELDWIRKRIEKKGTYDVLIFEQANATIAANCGPGTFGIITTERVTSK